MSAMTKLRKGKDNGKSNASARRKGKGKPKPPKNPMDREVPVKLGKDAIRIRENELADKILLLRRLRYDLRESSKARRAEIDALVDDIQKLAQTCIDGVENRRQGDLRFEDAQAKETLGKVAEKIEGGKVTKPEKAPQNPLPSEPHEFRGKKGKPTICEHCESELSDPVHEVQGLPTIGTPTPLQGAEARA